MYILFSKMKADSIFSLQSPLDKMVQARNKGSPSVIRIGRFPVSYPCYCSKKTT